MAEVKQSQEVCPRCGAGVRDNTFFCYSCGADVKSLPVETAPERTEEEAPPSESEKALDDLADKLSSKPDEEKVQREKAAKERRKARVSQRKLRQYVWEPRESPPIAILFGVSAAALALAALAIYAVLVAR